MNTASQQLLALLFVAGEAVTKRELMRLLNLDVGAVDKALAEVADKLADTGLALVMTDQSAELATSPGVADFLAAFLALETQGLTRAAAETLALVAYCGPLTRYEVDSLRGVDSRRTLRGLTHAGLLWRRPGQGRAAAYSVSEEFLRGAGVTRREDLPNFAELSAHQGVARLLGREAV